MPKVAKIIIVFLVLVILGEGGFWLYKKKPWERVQVSLKQEEKTPTVSPSPRKVTPTPAFTFTPTPSPTKPAENRKTYTDEEVGFTFAYPVGFFPETFEHFVRADHLDELKSWVGPGAIDVEAEKAEIEKGQVTGQWQIKKSVDYYSAEKFVQIGDIKGKLMIGYIGEEAGLRLSFVFYKDFWRILIWHADFYFDRPGFDVSQKASYHNRLIEALVAGTANPKDQENLRIFEELIQTLKKL